MTANDSLITKKIIAYSFKKLLKTNDFSKISITQIMAKANYRRQTFYDHFQDKFDLLNWIYEQEMTEVIDHFTGYEHWYKTTPRILNYFKKNLHFYQKVMLIPDDNGFDACLLNHSKVFLTAIVTGTKKEPLSSVIPVEQLDFYAYGFSGMLRDWLKNNCQPSIAEMEKTLIQVVEASLLNQPGD